MKIGLWAVMMTAAVALMLSACTRDYSNGTTETTGDVLRPGGTPPDVGRHPGGTPVEAPDQITDPNAPKESNGGSGSEASVLSSGTAEPTAEKASPAR